MKHIRKTVFHYPASVRNTKNGGFQKKGLGWTGISTFDQEMFLGQKGPSTPMIDIFFCLEWLKVKPSALILSQALLFRKSGNPKKQTKNKSCPEMVARQHSRRQEQEKTSDRFCRRLAMKKIKSRHFIL